MSEILPSVEIDSEGFVLVATVLSSVPADDNVVVLGAVDGNGSVAVFVAVFNDEVTKYEGADVVVVVAGDGSFAGNGKVAGVGVGSAVVVVTDGSVGSVVVGVVGQVWCRCASSLL